MYNQTIGLIGGFGAYATLGFYKRLIDAFVRQSERELPHIFLDCDFTMPSRTRALLYNESYDLVVKGISESVTKLINCGVDYIILVCGTAHFFLEDIYQRVPESKDKVVNIIEILDRKLKEENIHSGLVVAAEGTLLRGVYPKYLKSIECKSPSDEYYSDIRFLIEAVKNNRINKEIIMKYKRFLEEFDENNIILGCTEFPILTEYARKNYYEMFREYCFYDPLEYTIEYLKRVLE